MNIIELAQECQLIGMRPHLDGIYQKALEHFAALVEAHEREALEKIDWTALMREGSLVTWGEAQELGDRVLAAIRARGTT
jgi:ABC-type protease/lipase transport system fused ATPase/permease subunit